MSATAFRNAEGLLPNKDKYVKVNASLSGHMSRSYPFDLRENHLKTLKKKGKVIGQTVWLRIDISLMAIQAFVAIMTWSLLDILSDNLLLGGGIWMALVRAQSHELHNLVQPIVFRLSKCSLAARDGFTRIHLPGGRAVFMDRSSFRGLSAEKWGFLGKEMDVFAELTAADIFLTYPAEITAAFATGLGADALAGAVCFYLAAKIMSKIRIPSHDPLKGNRYQLGWEKGKKNATSKLVVFLRKMILLGFSTLGSRTRFEGLITASISADREAMIVNDVLSHPEFKVQLLSFYVLNSPDSPETKRMNILKFGLPRLYPLWAKVMLSAQDFLTLTRRESFSWTRMMSAWLLCKANAYILPSSNCLSSRMNAVWDKENMSRKKRGALRGEDVIIKKK
jgi:hypothetical protein